MKISPRLCALAAAALAAAVFVACGETVIDDVKTEEALKDNVESTLGKKVKSVECPSGVEVEPKAKFECTITPQKGKDETAILQILNDDADVRVVEIRSGNVDLSLGG
jgi:Domain of unknown function (DUF4333)